MRADGPMTELGARWPQCGLLAALLLVAAVTPGEAYVVQTFEGTLGPVQEHWRNPEQIPFILHRAGSADLTAETTYRLLRESFAVWDSVCTARVGFVDRGLSSARGPTQGDRLNLLFFDETNAYLQAPPESGVIALTRLSSNEVTGEIQDADITFNGKDFHFSESLDLPEGTVNLKDVAIHEIGHLLGLDHTAVDGPPETRPTMNPYNRGDGPGEGQSLEPDDLAGISVLYPAEGYLDSTGAIAGRVTGQDGTPLFGTHLVAENLDTGARVGVLSGAEPKAATVGDYLLAGLVPGRYRLHVEPLSGEITEANFGGIFTGLAVGFTPEYYDNAETADLAQTLSVTAGSRVEGIDFTTGLQQPGHPYLLSIARLANTPDAAGPYRLQLEMAEATEVLLRWRIGSAGAVTATALERRTGNAFEGRIPGQPVGTRVEYQIEAEGTAGKTLVYPGTEEWLSFEVVRLSGAPLAFTALRGEDAVGVLDTGTGQEVSRIAVADEPIQVLLAPSGGRLYVSCLAGGKVEVIDTGTFQLVDRIATGTMPLDLALSPSGKRLYVTDSGSGTLTLANLETGESRTVQLPAMDSGPYGVAVAGDRVFVADLAANRVLILDADGAVLGAVPVPGEPRSLAPASDGSEVYVSSMSSGTLTVIDAASGQLSRSLALPAAGTFAVAPSPKGTKVYLTAYGEGLLLAVDPRDGRLGPTVAVGANPRAVSFSPDGALAYVTSADADEIAVVDAVADTLIRRLSTGDQPRGIALTLPPKTPGPDTAVTNAAVLPVAVTLARAYPNPFNATVQLGYQVGPRPVEVTLSVYDLLGQVVRRLVDGPLEPGEYTASWDGRNEDGRAVATGAYLVVLRAAERQSVEKVLLLR